MSCGRDSLMQRQFGLSFRALLGGLLACLALLWAGGMAVAQTASGSGTGQGIAAYTLGAKEGFTVPKDMAIGIGMWLLQAQW